VTRSAAAERDSAGFLIEEKESLPQIFIQADVPLSRVRDWVAPLALFEGMLGGRDIYLHGPLSVQLKRNLNVVQDILCSWLPDARRIRVESDGFHSDRGSGGRSLFFSAGVDSSYSLLKHRHEIDRLILVHGFDIPLEDQAFFDQVRAVAEEVAAAFGKRLIVARTNLRKQPECCNWELRHGAALASVAHALAPNHSAVYVASSHPYRDIGIWGSSPILDPLWSSESVEIVHDGADLGRVEKLRSLSEHPELIRRLRVCWQNSGRYNCGRCQKCLRTMIVLSAFHSLQHAPFGTSSVDPAEVRRLELTDDTVLYWRELLNLDVPQELRAAIEHAVANYTWRLPPHGGLRNELRRVYHGSRQIGRLLRVLLS